MFPAIEKYRIDILSALILVALTLAAGISVFVVMQRQAESTLSKNLESLLQSDERLFKSTIEQSLVDIKVVATRRNPPKNLQLLASNPGNTTAQIELQQIAQSFLPTGFSGMSFSDVRGREVARAGHFSQKHELRVPLDTKYHAFLLWDGQFILHASSDILDPHGHRIGMVTTEARLVQMTDVFADIAPIGKTGEFAVCAPLADDKKNMDCFLNRASGKDFKRLVRVVGDKPLPMNYALNGESGIIDTMDYRREHVIAAYAPVGAFGLGMVLKIDRAELNHPILVQLKFITPLLVALVLIGMLLLNFLVRPLVRKLIDSERETHDVNTYLHDTQEKLRSIYEGSNDAIMLVAENGFIDCNARTLEMFGLKDKTEFIGHLPSELSPPLQPDGQDSSVAALEHIAKALRLGKNQFEWVHRRKSGEDFPAEVLLSAFDYAGERILQATVRDITEQKNTELALQRESSTWIQAMDSFADAIYLIDEKRHLVRANKTFYGMLHLDPQQVVGKHIAEIVHPLGEAVPCPVCRAQEERLDTVITMEADHPDNAARRPVEVSVKVIRDELGSQTGTLVSIHDLSHTRKIEESLLESEERFRRVADEAPFPMMIHAENGEVLGINKAWSEATGYTHAEIPTVARWLKHAYEQSPITSEDVQEIKSKIERTYGINARVDQGEQVIRCKDGSFRTWHFSAAPVGKLTDGRRYVVSMAQDVSERKAAQEQIEFLAYHDALTKLPNRLLAKDHLQQAIWAAQRENFVVALLFIDLDKFKTINDSLGHVIGDGLLKGVAIRLRECLRDTDTLSRQGGDEFLIVLNNMRDTESITVVVEKIQARLAEPFVIDQHELAISLSIGIAVYPNDGKDFDTLLKQSDTAMYQAKESGRNTYRFHTEQMNTDAVEHLRMRNGLRRALEQGEFSLHYQPQISLANGAVIGVEALIRWNHPELGMVPPGRFISIAEDSGLIVPMGDWVLREACRQAVAWRKAGLPEMLVAVNLSAVQFKRGDVEKCVTQALEESGLDPSLLELELTESILIKDPEKVLSTVHQLKTLGVKFSIDDFGTGYSSLSYLKRFNVDKLKIDQSFVRDMADDPNDAAIVNAIIQMAKSLGLTTIAEGVEDERQLELLRQLYCDEVQGYHFARPMPADEIAGFISKRRASVAK